MSMSDCLAKNEFKLEFSLMFSPSLFLAFNILIVIESLLTEVEVNLYFLLKHIECVWF